MEIRTCTRGKESGVLQHDMRGLSPSPCQVILPRYARDSGQVIGLHGTDHAASPPCSLTGSEMDTELDVQHIGK
jgi:hypothetical protein